MSQALFQASGSRDEKETRFAPVATNRFFLGLHTNRNPLRSPAGIIYDSYYKIGGADALIAGSNVEISNRLTICRRPGNTAGLSTFISSSNVPDVIDSFYSFHEVGGNVRVFADTPTAVYLVGGAVNNVGTASQGIIPIFTKPAGVTQSFFQGVGQSLYVSDASEQQKWLDFGAGNPGNSFSTITNTSLTSNVATVTAINNFAVGQTIVIAQTTNGAGVFNGTFVIASVNPNYFTFNLTNANVGSASDTGFANGCWNLGISPPFSSPTLNIVASGSAAIQWAASTVFSTFGIIVDGNGNVQQMISVNASGTNSTQFGTTSHGEPAWNQTPGGTTSDNTITWTNWGPIPAWAAHQIYTNAALGGTVANPSQIYDPGNKVMAINVAPGNAQGTSGGTKPNFVAIQGANQHDPSNQGSPPAVRWWSVFPAPSRWKPSTSYPAFLGTDTAATCIIEPSNLPAGTGETVYLQISGGGTSGASGTAPAFSSVTGQRTTDGDLIWLCLGTATRANSTAYTAWSGTNPTFSVIKVGSNLFVCTQNGTSAGSPPTFLTTYGDKTTDGSVVWTCVGNSMSWASNTQWYLPASGFVPPSGAQPYGGAQVIGSAFVQAVVASGLSGGSAPSWSTTPGNNTTDNAATWRCVAAQSQNSISWSKGYGYCYAYKARAVNDAYAPLPAGGGFNPPGTGLGINPAFGIGAGGLTPTGSADGSVSTASPTAQMAVGVNTGSVVYITGLGSADPQIDTVVIFRTADGGSTFFELTEIKNPQPVAGAQQVWSFQDFLPDNANASFPGLNTLVVAPLAVTQFNNRPVIGAINLVQHLGRMFYSVGATVYASNGPLVGGASQPPGNGYTSFSPSQFWTFPSPVTRMIATTSGLLVFTTSDVGIIVGGPSITTLFAYIRIPGLGLTSYNALAIKSGVIYLLTSDNQCVSLDPNLGISEIGFPVGDQINSISPSNAYATFLIQGSNDKALYLADGSTGWFRVNPNQSPDSAISGPVWSPKATIVGGCKAIAALEIKPGQQALLLGATSANQPILVRDSSYTTFTDNGSSYSANFTFGSIVLANPGQLAEVGFITCEFQKTGTSPKLSILLDEIFDTVISISAAVQSAGNTTYTYTLTSGPAVSAGMFFTITGMADSGNNGTFGVSSTGAGTFTVANPSGVTRSSQSGQGTRFEDLSGYISSTTGLPPQDSPYIWGLTGNPNSIFANRYYLLQSINGITPPLGAFCRHMQIKISYGNDTVQNELLSQTIWGAHLSEQ